MLEKHAFLLVRTCSVVPNSATPWTEASQALLSMLFPRQEYWSVWPSLSPGDLPHPGIEPVAPELAGGWILYH